MAVQRIAVQFTNHRAYLVTVETAAEKLKAFSAVLDGELADLQGARHLHWC